MEQALFGMGCFWSPQDVFTRLDGVVQVTSGFAGVDDNSRKASYISVCGGDGRTEAILIDFFPTVVSYPELLQTFWRHHDATKIQKPQYHSIIFPFNDQQRALAELDVQLADATAVDGILNKQRTRLAVRDRPILPLEDSKLRLVPRTTDHQT